MRLDRFVFNSTWNQPNQNLVTKKYRQCTPLLKFSETIPDLATFLVF